MSSSPRIANLEQLPNQAKELLRAVRAGDQRARGRVEAHLPRFPAPSRQHSSDFLLADALLVVARAHGFAS